METPEILTYHLCPRCQRAVPAVSKESYCPNDGTKMLTGCPECGAGITSPYSRFCSACGKKLLGNVPREIRSREASKK